MTVVKLRTKTTPVALVCEECGAEGRGSCGCGAPYVPVGKRAVDAVARNPEKSDRAIAKEIGASHQTVARARTSTGPDGPVGKRVGQDGKQRSLPKPKLVAPPLSQQVNKMLDRLDDHVRRDCEEIEAFMLEHPDLEDEGRNTILRFLQLNANRLMDLAQKIDGR